MWPRLARLPFIWRLLVKWILLLFVILFALYPHPGLLFKHVQHLRNIESLIQPDLPEIAVINHELDAHLNPNGSRKDEFRAVERYVNQRIPYQFDWFNWGNLDYWPTTQEVLERNTEDCDGRAVLAASILQARGFKTARIVGNIDHVWVTVDGAELMSPQPDKNYTHAGAKARVSLPQLRTWLRAASKICKFPAVRSLLILAAVLVLAYHPCRNVTGLLAAAVVLLIAFALMVDWASRFNSRDPHPVSLQLVISFMLALGSVIFALCADRFLARNPAVPAGSGQPREQNRTPD